MKRLRTLTGTGHAHVAIVVAALGSAGFPGSAFAAEFGQTCQDFIATIAKTNGTAAPAADELAKQCECVAGKMSSDDKGPAMEGLDRIVQAGKTGKAPEGDFSEEQKAAMKKFGEANSACP